VRAHLFGNSGAKRIIEQLRELAGAGITIHTQVVVCPGINDGEELDSTLHDLASLFPEVASVSVVPVGVTKYQKFEHSFFPVDMPAAMDIIGRVDQIQTKCSQTFRYRFAFAADELFLKAGLGIPKAEYYEDFPQLENGVGMVRLFLEELS
jgi:NifB/MoaA-like Fe-S oxidoreductase